MTDDESQIMINVMSDKEKSKPAKKSIEANVLNAYTSVINMRQISRR